MNYEKLVKALRSASTVSTAWEKLMRNAAAAIEELQAELEKKRTADCWGCKCEKLEPKRGNWMNVADSYFWYGRCSVCGAELNVDGWYGNLMNYCPNCGAKMEVQE